MAKELESATDTGLELNKMLTDFLTSQKENASLSSNLEHLQSQITRQEEIITTLRNKTKQTDEEVFETTNNCAKSSNFCLIYRKKHCAKRSKF